MAKTQKQQREGKASAERSRAKAAEANGGESELKQSITTFPAKKVVTDLLKAAKTKKQADVDNSTEYAGAVKQAQSNHLNKDAFNQIKKIAGWTPEKLADYLEHFDYYLEVTGLEKKAESAPRFEGVGGPKDDPKDAEFSDDKTGDTGKKVVGFPAQTH